MKGNEILKKMLAVSIALLMVQGAGFTSYASTPEWSGATVIGTVTSQSDQTYSSTSSDENALLIKHSSGKVTIKNPTVTKSGGPSGHAGDNYSFYGINSAVMCKGGGTTEITGGTVTTNAAGANGVFSYGANNGTTNAKGDGTTVNITDTTITTTEDGSGGIMTTYGGTTVAKNLTVTTSGRSSAPIRTDRGGGWVTVTGGKCTSNGVGSPVIYSTADVKVSGATLISNKSEGVCIEGNGSISLTDCSLTADNNEKNGNAQYYDTIMIYQSMSGDATGTGSEFSMTGGTLNSKNGHVFHVTNTTAAINLDGLTINNSDSDNILLSVVNDGWKGNANSATLTANNMTLDGNIIVSSEASSASSSASSLTLHLTGGTTFNGKIDDGNGSNSFSNVSVIIDEGCTWNLTGASFVTNITNNGTINENGYSVNVSSGNSEGGGSSDTTTKNTFSIGDTSYEYSYTNSVSYTGQKLILSDLTIGQQRIGGTMDGNVIFKSVKYKNNTNTGTAYAVPVFKAGKGADSTLRSNVKAANKYFKNNPLTFTVTECTLTSDNVSGSATYKSNGKWKFKLKCNTGAAKTRTLKYNKDFTVISTSTDQGSSTVQIQGKGNYRGTVSLQYSGTNKTASEPSGNTENPFGNSDTPPDVPPGPR